MSTLNRLALEFFFWLLRRRKTITHLKAKPEILPYKLDVDWNQRHDQKFNAEN